MSWKSFLTAGLLCVLASPVFAGTPEVIIRPGGTVSNNHINGASQWVWNVYINPDMSLNTNGASPGTPVAVEMGLRFNDTVLSATRINTALFDTLNPGKQIFTWESTSPLGVPCNANGNPCSIQIGGAGNKEVFAAVGSANLVAADRVNLGGGVSGIPFLQVVTNSRLDSDIVPSLSSSIEVLGAAAYGNKARVAQITAWNGTTYTTAPFDSFAGTFNRTAKPGDSDLNGAVNIDDYITFSLNYHPTNGGKFWNQGDSTGDGIVNIDDYIQFSLNYHPTNTYVVGNGGTLGGPVGGGSIGGGQVPEPASLALIGLATLGGLGLFGRKH